MNDSSRLQSIGQLIARVLIGCLFLVAGAFTLRAHSFYFPYVSSVGTPAPEPTLPFGYVIEIGAAIALILGWKARWAAWILLFYTIALTVVFNGIVGPDDAQYFNKVSHVAKNLGVVAGLLYIAAFGAGAMSLDELRGRWPWR